MRIAAGVLIIIVAVVNLFAGLLYLGIGGFFTFLTQVVEEAPSILPALFVPASRSGP